MEYYRNILLKNKSQDRTGPILWCLKQISFCPQNPIFGHIYPLDAEAFKMCKNTIKLTNLCALPCLGLGLWLTLTVYFDLA